MFTHAVNEITGISQQCALLKCYHKMYMTFMVTLNFIMVTWNFIIIGCVAHLAMDLLSFQLTVLVTSICLDL